MYVLRIYFDLQISWPKTLNMLEKDRWSSSGKYSELLWNGFFFSFLRQVLRAFYGKFSGNFFEQVLPTSGDKFAEMLMTSSPNFFGQSFCNFSDLLQVSLSFEQIFQISYPNIFGQFFRISSGISINVLQANSWNIPGEYSRVFCSGNSVKFSEKYSDNLRASYLLWVIFRTSLASSMNCFRRIEFFRTSLWMFMSSFD